MTLLDFTAFFAAMIALVSTVFFLCGRAWERAGTLAPVAPPAAADRETSSMLAWVRDMAGPQPAPPGPVLALAAPPRELPAPLSPVPQPGPVRSYSALAAWTLERDTTRDADTSVTKLTASIVRGMDYREQIDAQAAGILARARHALQGERAA
jgi:hypothetical protein